MTGFYLKIPFRSDTETHTSAFSLPAFMQISIHCEKEKDCRGRRLKKLNGDLPKEILYFPLCVAEGKKIAQAEKQIRSTQSDVPLLMRAVPF